MPPETLTPEKISAYLKLQQNRSLISGRSANTYIRLLEALLRSGRLNRSFPDRYGLIGLYRMLSPSASQNLYPELELGIRSGLPVLSAITRIQSDYEVAPRVVRDSLEQKPALVNDTLRTSSRQDDLYLRRYRYHRELLEAKPIPSFTIDLDLRWLNQNDQQATFITILDRFDMAAEMFFRYTILLKHSSPRWRRAQVETREDEVQVTDNFKNLIARTTAHDSELAFIMLSDIESIEIESVTRSQVGPLYFSGMQAPGGLARLVNNHPGEFILALPSDRTAVDIKEDRNLDPLSMGYRELLSEGIGETMAALQQSLGYHISRERKFVCTPGITKALKAFLKRRGARCVVYEAR